MGLWLVWDVCLGCDCLSWDLVFAGAALQGPHVPGALPSEGAKAVGAPIPRAHGHMATSQGPVLSPAVASSLYHPLYRAGHPCIPTSSLVLQLYPCLNKPLLAHSSSALCQNPPVAPYRSLQGPPCPSYVSPPASLHLLPQSLPHLGLCTYCSASLGLLFLLSC